MLGERDCERQPDIAKSNDADLWLPCHPALIPTDSNFPE
jgi:hypothetical protein